MHSCVVEFLQLSTFAIYFVQVLKYISSTIGAAFISIMYKSRSVRKGFEVSNLHEKKF